jgi:hypothetical protein
MPCPYEAVRVVTLSEAKGPITSRFLVDFTVSGMGFFAFGSE